LNSILCSFETFQIARGKLEIELLNADSYRLILDADRYLWPRANGVPIEMQLSERDDDCILEQAFELRQALRSLISLRQKARQFGVHMYHYRLRSC
jgi:hypothetical protein